MPLTDNGFVLPDFDDLLADIKGKIKNRLGDDTDVSDGSPMGKIAFVWADDKLETEERMEDVYDSSSGIFATGVSLDRLASNVSVQRILAQSSQAALKVTGTAGYLIDEGTEFITDNGDSFFTAADVQIGSDGTATVMANSEEQASYTNVDANTIINPANPVEEIETVTNPEAAAGGVDLETDYSLRRRFLINSNAAEGPTADGLITAVTNVAGVTGVNLQQNLTQQVDDNGNPAMTLHFFVSGGVPQDIADALANNMAAGAVTVGEQVFHVAVDGNDVEVHFDKAQSVSISFKITITSGDGYDQDAVNEAVSEFLDEFEMGETIVLNKLYSYLYALDGIEEVTDIQASSNSNTFSSNNIDVAKYQIASTSDALIEVVANA